MRRKLEFLLITLLLSGYLYGQNDYIDVSGDNVCPPATVEFTVNSDSLDLSSLSTSPLLRIGSVNIPVSGTNYGPYEHVFNEPGNFTVKLISFEDTNVVYARALVTVRQSLDSEFDAQVITEPYEYSFTPIDNIADTISDYSFMYTVYEDSIAIDTSATLFARANSLQNAAYTFSFPDTGTYTVQLMTQRIIPSCIQSSEMDITVEELAPADTNAIPIANYFVPDAQPYYIIDPSDPAVILSFKVFSRTGVLVFSTESPIIYWDGRNSFGQELGTGVYYYVLEAVEGTIGSNEPIMGFIHLFRN